MGDEEDDEHSDDMEGDGDDGVSMRLAEEGESIVMIVGKCRRVSDAVKARMLPGALGEKPCV